ncbi:hypothetical protein [Burkholderia ubonensis]|uniref:hypothetical protein n=1 Tax=Burkholderia ubonensis TaxID=101571 RepID=UPI0012F9ADC8|nr:hypothetical protein [Burkholderia ubonensis]
MDNKSQQQNLSIRVRHSTSGRLSFHTAELNLSTWHPQSILFRGGVELQKQARLTPVQATVVSSAKRAIEELSEHSARLLNQSPEEMTKDDLRQLLETIDNDFNQNSKITRVSARTYYLAIRRLITRVQCTLQDGTSMAHAQVITRKRGGKDNRPRLSDNRLPTSIAEISHTDVLELRRKTENILQQRVTSLENAVAQEIEYYENICLLQQELLQRRALISSDLATRIETWIDRKRGGSEKAFPKCDEHDAASIYLTWIETQVPELNKSGWPSGLRCPTSFFKSIPGMNEYRVRMQLWTWFWARHRLPNPVLTAIFLILLCHTGWNPHAVGSVTVDSFELQHGGGYRMQGYKSKTDDHTPISTVNSSAKLICKAIDLLLWNHKQLGLAGLIDTKIERRVWFGWQMDEFANTSNFVGRKRVASFCARHGLTIFSPSELRPLKAALMYLPQRDLEAVRVLLGHTDLLTSDRYLENTLFFRLNEAMMLEFQRRIETTLAHSSGGEQLVVLRRLDMRHVDNRLLVPTGDGGACADPKQGPNSLTLAQGQMCDGLRCQTDGGCHNYRLFIDSTTIEMALRTRLYYRSRWQALYDVNPEAFSRFHIPRLMFIFVLLRIVREQRPAVYEAAEAALK